MRRFGWLLALVLGATAMGAQVDECPLDHTALPFLNVKAGHVTGARLDLRPVGEGELLPPLKRCPRCGWVAAGALKRVTEEAQVRAALRAPAVAAVRDQPSTRLLLAVTLQQLRADVHDRARAWLEAAWETEGGEARFHQQALEGALEVERAHEEAMRRLSLESRPGSETADVARTPRLLQVELLRQLGRFDQAAALLERLAQAPEFRRGAYPSLLAQERALLAAKDPAPAEARPAKYDRASDDPATLLLQSFPGWAEFSATYEFSNFYLGGHELRADVAARQPGLVDQADWLNPLGPQDRQPLASYAALDQAWRAAAAALGKHAWVREWKDLGDATVVLQLRGARGWTSDLARVKARWTQAGQKGEPAWLFLLKRGGNSCVNLALGADAKVALLWDGSACPNEHWVDRLALADGEVVLVTPDGHSQRRTLPTPRPVSSPASDLFSRDPLLRSAP